jgi:hypothetical protein
MTDMKRILRVASFLFVLPWVCGCVFFDEIEYEDSASDYWSTGICPGNTATDPIAVSDNCRGVTLSGCCDINGNALYCHNGQLYCKSCLYNVAGQGRAECSWDPDESAYWCTTSDNGLDPNGVIRRSCPVLTP